MHRIYLFLFIFITLVSFPNFALSQCNMITTDGAMELKDVYHPSDAVYVSGVVSYKRPGTILPDADIYIIPGSIILTEGKSLTDCMGSKNRIVGPGFYDQLIAMPTLKQGTFTIVMDCDINGIYNAEFDCFSENAFSVRSSAPPPNVVINVGEIKTRAKEKSKFFAKEKMRFNFWIAYSKAFDETAGILDFAQSGITGSPVMAVVNMVIEKGVGKVVPNPIDAFNDWAIETGGKGVNEYFTSQEERWDDIAKDPPDKNYFHMMPPSVPDLMYSPSANFLDKHLADFASIIGIENTALNGILRSYEKYQGALENSDLVYIRTQALALNKYCQLWQSLQSKKLEKINTLKASMKFRMLDRTRKPEALNSLVSRVKTVGFTTDEIKKFKDIGMKLKDINKIKEYISTIPQDAMGSGKISDYLDSIYAYSQAEAADIAYLESKSREIIDVLTITASTTDSTDKFPQYEPDLFISGPDIIGMDTNTLYSIVDANTESTLKDIEYTMYDKFGFIDALGGKVIIRPRKEGMYLLTVRATNRLGYESYAMKFIEVVDPNPSVPLYVSKSPDTNFVTLTETYNPEFSINVSAVQEKLKYYWYLDGEKINETSSSAGFQLPIPYGLHVLTVKASYNDEEGIAAGAAWNLYYPKPPDPCIITELLSPPNDIKEIAPNVAFKWTECTDAEAYDLMIDDEDNFDTPLNEIESGENSIIVQLEPEKKYFWRVRAKNYLYTSEWSNVFIFETSGDNSNCVNLMVNPSGEAGNVSGWTDIEKLWSVYTVDSWGIVPPDGMYYFWADNNVNEKAEMYQKIDVSYAQDLIQDGKCFAHLSGWLCNWDQYPHDMSTLVLEALDENDNQLLWQEKTHRSPVWTYYNIDQLLPVGTKSLVIRLISTRFVGTANDGYFDNIKLCVNDLPPSVYVTVSSDSGKTQVFIGDTLQLTAKTYGGTDTEYEWSSNFPYNASVDEFGRLAAIERGKYQIQAKGKTSNAIGSINIDIYSDDDVIFLNPLKDEIVRGNDYYIVKWSRIGDKLVPGELSLSIDGGTNWTRLDYITLLGTLRYGWVAPITPVILSNCMLKMYFNEKESFTSLFSIVPDTHMILSADEESDGNFKVKITPNPCTSLSIISWEGNESNIVHLQIFDVLGNLVAEYENSQNLSNAYLLNAEALASGVYFCKISSGANNITAKIVVSK